MKLNDVKLYFNSIETRHSNKTGQDYYVLKLYDFDSNCSFDIFVQNPDKYKDYKAMAQYNFNLQVTKQNNLISINVIE